MAQGSANSSRRAGNRLRPGAHDRPKSSTIIPLPRSIRFSPTERRHPRSSGLGRMRLHDSIRLMLREDLKIPRRLLMHVSVIEKAVRLIARAFRSGGRLFYVGAGTSGRLGILD